MSRYANMFLGGGLVALVLKSVLHVGDLWIVIALVAVSVALTVLERRKGA